MSPISQPTKLKNDVTTRWNSTYLMFQRLLQVQDPITATIALLVPFEQLTWEMSEEKRVTLYKVILVVRGLKSASEKIRTKSRADNMRGKCNR